ncbi:hypothetical protein SARC_01049 [Sphaeroforma arctica JP610]|uniref:XRCC3/RAD51 homolog 2 helix-hairpin-helix domain-containing protein n=1 Tax=Sphaeroforma arctica JP610 TaxID=667725 RepID=A0A0L0GCS4_9EUKA|nr:hypothetical protein SARC_01049 [Sphaeroforma arctica JP610]KNC86817.1 hypothetical protein SARC_01049 [Sphaeroforma arctica JP610]|eukprot:XP_014160719.1 hypothetical protein SARC_01049 [Sphaeroforma arctica JP610]
MTTRKLQRVNFEWPSVHARLERNKFYTCADVLSISKYELIDQLDIDYHVAESVYNAIALASMPKGTNAATMLAETTYLPIGLGLLDEQLKGGLLSGTLTEVVGPSGAGKTQFCLQSVINAVLGSGVGPDPEQLVPCRIEKFGFAATSAPFLTATAHVAITGRSGVSVGHLRIRE